MTIPLLVWRVWAALKTKQTPIPTSVETDLMTLPSISHKYLETVQTAFASLSTPLHVSVLKILEQART